MRKTSRRGVLKIWTSINADQILLTMPLGKAFLIIFTFSMMCGCDLPLEKYEPGSQDEHEIVSVLIGYQEARNRFDLERLLPLLHEKGEYSFQCGMMVSKSKLKKMLPGFWAEITSGNSAIIPLVHECINGDYYHTGKLNNPRIEIDNDKASATVLFTKGVCRVPLYVALCRENDRWLITRTEWGDS
jgi:hypothetical protein